MSSMITKVHPRAVMQLQKEFSKPFANKCLTEFRKESPVTFSAIGSKAQISNTATDHQVSSQLLKDDLSGSNALSFAASKKLLLEESLRRSTQLNVGNLLIEKAHKTAMSFSAVLHEDL